MGKGRGIRGGPFSRVIEPFQEFSQMLISRQVGMVATDGAQYSPIATVGTIAVAVLQQEIDPGCDIRLSSSEVEFTQSFQNLKADSVGTVTYYWDARQKSGGAIGVWVPISEIYTKGIGTALTVEDTLSGLLNIATLPEAPLEFRLLAVGLVADSMAAKVKASSYVIYQGHVIPGT